MRPSASTNSESGAERHRVAEGVAEAHVDEPRLVEVDAQREVVVLVALGGRRRASTWAESSVTE